MHEPLLDRIRQLERAVRRWKLVCVALFLAVLGFMAISGTFGIVLLLREADLRDVRMQAVEEEEVARLEAVRAQQVEAARKQLDQAKKGGPEEPDGNNP
jgi:hypothetical protein